MTFPQRYLAIVCFSLSFGGFSAFGQSLAVTDADVVLEKEAAAAPQPIALKRQIAAKREDLRLEPEFLSFRAGVFNQRLVKRTVLTTGMSDKLRVLRESVFRESARYGIDPDLVLCLIWEESRFHLNAVSPKGAKGPLQMLPETAARFGARNAHDPDQAARAGIAYLVWLLDRYRGNVSLALGAYNSGEGATDAFSTGRTIVLRSGKVINRRGAKTGIPPYNETQEYVRRIANRYRALKNLPR
jgi:soluble lytic murein transglycosylase-like protein